MYISQIIANNFKGTSFKRELTPVTVLSGLNSRWKTASLEAAMLAYAGKIPDIAESPKLIYDRFASGEVMTVAIKTDNNWSITRSYGKGTKGTSIQYGFEGFPDGYEAPSMLFSNSDFIGLSAPERTKLLFRTLPPPSLEKVGPSAIITNIKNIKGEPHTEDHEKAIKDLCEFTDKSYGDCVTQASMTIQEWLSAFVEKIKERATNAARTAKQMRSTILGIAQNKSVDQLAIGSSEQARDNARLQLDEANTRLNTVNADINSSLERHKTKKAEAAKIAIVSDLDVLNVELEIEKLTKNLSKIKVLTAQTPDTKKLKSLTQNVVDSQAKHDEVHIKWSSTIDALNAIDAEIKETKSAKTCLTCGQSISKLKKKVLDSLGNELSKASHAQRESRVMLNECESNLVSVKNALETEQKEHDSYNRNIVSMSNLQNQISELKEKLSGVEKRKPILAEIQEIESKGKTLREQQSELLPIVASKQEAFDQADLKHKQAVADASAAREQQKAAKAADVADAEAFVTKQLSDFLKELLIVCINQSVAPLLKSLNDLCGGIVDKKVVMQDGELGLETDEGKFVSWKTCSDSQQILMQAAIKVALAVTSSMRICTIPRLESLDYSAKHHLIHKLILLTNSRTLAQAILIEVSPSPEPIEKRYEKFAVCKTFSAIEC